MAKKWIQAAHVKPGGLHKSLGIATDKPISGKVLNKALHSTNPTIKKQAVLAETFRKMKK